MLANKSRAGVAPEMNLTNASHEGDETHKGRYAQLLFEPRDSTEQKHNSVIPRKRTDVLKN